MQYDLRFINEERKRKMISAVAQRDAYIVGGRSAELRGEGGTPRSAGHGASTALEAR
jgi:hypothetical protein